MIRPHDRVDQGQTGQARCGSASTAHEPTPPMPTTQTRAVASRARPHRHTGGQCAKAAGVVRRVPEFVTGSMASPGQGAQICPSEAIMGQRPTTLPPAAMPTLPPHPQFRPRRHLDRLRAGHPRQLPRRLRAATACEAVRSLRRGSVIGPPLIGTLQLLARQHRPKTLIDRLADGFRGQRYDTEGYRGRRRLRGVGDMLARLAGAGPEPVHRHQPAPHPATRTMLQRAPGTDRHF